MMTRIRYNRQQKGVVLIMVLWLLVLLELLVASQAVTARVEGELVRNRVESLTARAAAEAGLYMTIDLLARQKGSKEILIRTDGGLYSMDYNNVSVLVRVMDESGKIDLNAAKPELLRNIVTSVAGKAEKGISLSDAILDWRDTDHNPRGNGAEDDEYQEAEMRYGAKDEYFDNLEELLLVLGMEGDIYSKLSLFLTVNTGSAGINPAVAQRRVLLAIPGADAHQVDEFLKARERHYRLGDPMPIFPVQDMKYITQTQDQLYTIHVQATTASGTTERIAVLTRVTTQNAKHGIKPYEVLSWYAHDQSPVFQSP